MQRNGVTSLRDKKQYPRTSRKNRTTRNTTKRNEQLLGWTKFTTRNPDQNFRQWYKGREADEQLSAVFTHEFSRKHCSVGCGNTISTGVFRWTERVYRKQITEVAAIKQGTLSRLRSITRSKRGSPLLEQARYFLQIFPRTRKCNFARLHDILQDCQSNAKYCKCLKRTNKTTTGRVTSLFSFLLSSFKRSRLESFGLFYCENFPLLFLPVEFRLTFLHGEIRVATIFL